MRAVSSTFFEVKSGVIKTFDGEEHEVQGGAYLSPEHYLSTHAELERSREKSTGSSSAMTLLIAVGLLGFAAGLVVGRPSPLKRRRHISW